MPELNRGISVHGKSRVYFACHPADFAACFEPLTAEYPGQEEYAVRRDEIKNRLA